MSAPGRGRQEDDMTLALLVVLLLAIGCALTGNYPWALGLAALFVLMLFVI